MAIEAWECDLHHAGKFNSCNSLLLKIPILSRSTQGGGGRRQAASSQVMMPPSNCLSKLLQGC